ncbi:MAG: right-handed parallel beta-helix repeat-containing protein [Phenylobacterium sp.]|uniref:right-handed parallel beta-helix repeat-containing protein n=1 Tax=Phenylobacterium sp. TaxID=1871053 RepID=UPI001A4B7857|nr:right-handed parallel beta-helix repeat-containing protein [Phenylobacterium sp.]MBL8556278.1 right-handed parallel beta-helix repeat-containing protein [Phenylobacterium sp.]
MSVVAVSDAAALAAALRAAQPGDVIALAAGRYDDVAISKLTFAGAGITITSQDSRSPAEISGLNVQNSGGITFRGLTLLADPDDGAIPNLVSGSERIAFDRVYFHGSLNGDPTDDVGGLQIRGSADVSVTHSTFEQLYWAISHLDDTRLTISDNEFHDLRMDGVRGGGSSNVTIARNSFRDFHIKDGDHGDVIQFWTTNTTASAHDILVEDNIFSRGDGYYVQGICLRDENGGLPYERVIIRGNILVGSTYNAITVDHAVDVAVENNTVQALLDRNSYIRLTRIDGLTVDDNATMRLTILESSDVSETGRVILAPVADGAAALRALLSPRVVSMTGTSADDLLLGGVTGNVMRGGEGDDVLQGSAGFDDINGNQGADTASGGSGDDWVVGGKDDDRLSGDAGDDLVYGNLGNDTCEGGSGDDTLRGGQQDDLLFGGAGDDYLSGDRGSDTLTGGAGADTFHAFGEAGLERIADFSFAEGDRLVLDFGTTYSLAQSGADTIVSLGGGGQVVLAGVALSSLGAGWIAVG